MRVGKLDSKDTDALGRCKFIVVSLFFDKVYTNRWASSCYADARRVRAARPAQLILRIPWSDDTTAQRCGRYGDIYRSLCWEEGEVVVEGDVLMLRWAGFRQVLLLSLVEAHAEGEHVF
jgi:hypothetical protein